MTGKGRLSPETASSAASSQLIEENLRNVGPSASKRPHTSPPRSPSSTIDNAAIGATSVQAHSHGTINVDPDSNPKQHCRRLRRTDYLFLQACVGVVDNNPTAVEAYLSSGGNPTRQLTRDEVSILNRASAFDVGLTLVHLAIRFKREDLLATMLSFEVTGHPVKRPPSQVCPDLSADIRKEIALSLRQRKGDFPCYFVTDILTFILPEIEFLPSVVRTQLFDELLDQDVQKELEQESQIINWSIEIGNTLGGRLFALWNRTAGDCLLDSALQATWGVFDTDGTLRRALGDSLNEGGERRPIIVYGVKFIKSFRGENLGYARFQGVYLPLLWEQSFCWKTPIALGYTRGHFSALVPIGTESEDNLGAGANLNTSDDTQTVYLPLTDYEGKLLPVHFITPLEVGTEEKLLNDWLDCCSTPGGLMVAQQIHHKKRPVLIGQMVEEWLQRYRRIAQQL
ncbi:putative ubiquitin thioesterase zranb1 isoform X2 [Apostichopus japonicus]|uniref:ubiquitinyl hydrolase 1 n=1 Tax=Stichopus japonicus TaxID=307972 RepID=A0A2G8L400_STIJA|nr:putative ubiquitin thioesterase zranb1 isoform X2 [Apostichopus japonicus]